MSDVEEVVKLLLAGQVVIIPTDTVYGLTARAADPDGVGKLYRLKDRHHKPGTLIAANLEQLEQLGLKHRYLTAVKQFWPGAVSVVIPCSDPALAYLHLGQNSLAVRIPDDQRLSNVLTQTGPLLTSSANHPGQPPANTVGQARAYFGDRIDYYWDGGDLGGRQPSTVIRIVDDAIEVLRQGAVKIDQGG